MTRIISSVHYLIRLYCGLLLGILPLFATLNAFNMLLWLRYKILHLFNLMKKISRKLCILYNNYNTYLSLKEFAFWTFGERHNPRKWHNCLCYFSQPECAWFRWTFEINFIRKKWPFIHHILFFKTRFLKEKRKTKKWNATGLKTV